MKILRVLFFSTFLMSQAYASDIALTRVTTATTISSSTENANQSLIEGAVNSLDGDNISTTANLTFANGTMNGNVELGDGTSDLVSVNGRFDTDLIPTTTGTYDLGSSSLDWAEAYVNLLDVDDSATFGGKVDIDMAGQEKVTIDGGLTNIGGGSYTLADGDNDLGIDGDLEVNGNMRLDGATTTVQSLVIAGASATVEVMNITSSNNGAHFHYGASATNGTPEDADQWWNGTDILIRSGGTSYTLDKTTVSDKRFKKDIVVSGDILPDFKKLEVVDFTYTSDIADDTTTVHTGLLAQDVKKIFPKAVREVQMQGEQVLQIEYKALIPYLIKSVQELEARVEVLETTQQAKSNPLPVLAGIGILGAIALMRKNDRT